MATIADMRNFLGLDSTTVPDDTMTECILQGTELCSIYMSQLGGGTASETSIKQMSASIVFQYMDAMNIKPSSISILGNSVSSDVRQAIEQFRAIAIRTMDDSHDASESNSSKAVKRLYHVRRYI
jgi:hypothetical protein